jgi:serine protease
LATTAIAANAPASLTDQIIVKFNSPSVSGELRALGLSRAINQRLTHLRQTAGGAYVYKLNQRQDLSLVRGLAQALEAVNGVSYAEADQMMQPVQIPNQPNDPLYSSVQWHYKDGAGGINAPVAWALLSPLSQAQIDDDDNVYVAVVDTGYRPHSDLVANLARHANGQVVGADLIGAYDPRIDVANDGDGRDMDPTDPGDGYIDNYCGALSGSRDSSWHGTHVAGTIAANTDNGTGVAGVTYNLAKVIPVRVLGRCGGYLSDIADGIRWAVGLPVTGLDNNATPAQVINMSLGGSGSCSTTYQNAINAAVAAGTSVVVAAGNSEANASGFQPANCDGVITVAATNINGELSYYSNYGAVVDIAAPGGEMSQSDATGGIASTLNSGLLEPANDNYEYYQGTSMAAPHVAGIAALMLVKDPSLTPVEVEAWLKTTARAFPAPCNECGAGIADAGAVITAVSGGAVLPTVPTVPTVTSVLDNADGSADLFWTDSDSEEQYQLQRQKRNKRKLTGWADITPPAPNNTRYTDQSGTGTFTYRLRAINSAGSSDWSVSPEVVVTDGTDSGGSGKPDKPCRGKNC